MSNNDMSRDRTKEILEDAISYLFGKYSSDVLSDLHLVMDGTPDELFFELFTSRLAKERPDLFSS